MARVIVLLQNNEKRARLVILRECVYNQWFDQPSGLKGRSTTQYEKPFRVK